MKWMMSWKKFWKNEDGIGTLEILLIIAVLVAIAVVFREQIIEWVNQLFGQANTEIEKTDDNLNDLWEVEKKSSSN